AAGERCRAIRDFRCRFEAALSNADSCRPPLRSIAMRGPDSNWHGAPLAHLAQPQILLQLVPIRSRLGLVHVLDEIREELPILVVACGLPVRLLCLCCWGRPAAVFEEF